MDRHAEEQAIGRDLEACDLGLALTRPGTALHRRYKTQRQACMDRIGEMNREDGLDDGISDADLLAELQA